MTNLRTEEKEILNLLQQYGPLTLPQITKLINDKSDAVCERMVKSLSRHGEIVIVNSIYYGLSKMDKVEKKTSLAVWVLAELIGKMSDKQNHYTAIYPSQIYFILNNIPCEIVVVPLGQESIVRGLNPSSDDLQYIFVLYDDSQNEKISPLVPKGHKFTFASVIFDGESDAPKVKIW